MNVTASSRGDSSGSVKRKVDDLAADLIGNAVPDPPGLWLAIFQRIDAADQEAVDTTGGQLSYQR